MGRSRTTSVWIKDELITFISPFSFFQFRMAVGQSKNAMHSISQRRTFEEKEELSRVGWHHADYSMNVKSKDSIQLDLKSEIFTKNAGRTVYLFHSPPYNTCADLTDKGKHVGSVAIRQFIETYQPYLTLHGHIHETVEMSGSFFEKIGTSFVATSGNDPLYHRGKPVGKTVYFLDIDLSDLSTMKHIRLE